MSSLIWGELSHPAISDLARRDVLAILPLGCTEQHGRHLPVDTDTYQVEKLVRLGADKASDRYGTETVRLPTLSYGPTSEHLGFPGSVGIPNELYVRLVKDLIASILDSGFRRVAIVLSCGGHWAVPAAVWDARADAERVGRHPVLRFMRVEEDWATIRSEYFDEGAWGHAGAVETSLCMAGRPELVRTDEMTAPDLDRLSERYFGTGEAFLFRDMSSTGALGSTAGSSAEIGEKSWEHLVDKFAERLHAMESLDKQTLARTGSKA